MEQYQICKKITNYDDAVKLDLNEFDFEHHPDIYETVKNNVSKPKVITHYSNIYNDNTVKLINKICDYNKIETDQIIVSAGSDDALEYIINRYVTKDTHVLLFVPSYNYFEIVIKRRTKNIHYIDRKSVV